MLVGWEEKQQPSKSPWFAKELKPKGKVFIVQLPPSLMVHWWLLVHYGSSIVSLFKWVVKLLQEILSIPTHVFATSYKSTNFVIAILTIINDTMIKTTYICISTTKWSLSTLSYTCDYVWQLLHVWMKMKLKMSSCHSPTLLETMS